MPTVLNIPFPLVFLYWHGISAALAMLNYSLWVRFQTGFLSEDLRNTYLAFCIIGLLVYGFIGGPMFFLGYKYSSTQKARDKKVRIGLVAMYFASTLPLFLIDLYIVWYYGVLYVLQGVVFVLELIAWSTGSFAVWFIYMWQVAKLVHTKRCGSRQMQFQSTYAMDSIKPPHAMSRTKALHGQPDVI
jgi:hypothetical protein